MELAEAKALLNGCVREELHDRTVGDAEVFWSRNYVQIADGQFSGTTANVWFKTIGGDETVASFYGQPALELRSCGTEGSVYNRDELVEGHIEPEATKVNVFDRGVDL